MRILIEQNLLYLVQTISKGPLTYFHEQTSILPYSVDKVYFDCEQEILSSFVSGRLKVPD